MSQNDRDIGAITEFLGLRRRRVHDPRFVGNEELERLRHRRRIHYERLRTHRPEPRRQRDLGSDPVAVGVGMGGQNRRFLAAYCRQDRVDRLDPGLTGLIRHESLSSTA